MIHADGWRDALQRQFEPHAAQSRVVLTKADTCADAAARVAGPCRREEEGR